jgi:hypothetical protein
VFNHHKIILVESRNQYFHTFFNTLAIILQEYEKDKNALFLIIKEDFRISDLGVHVPFVYKILKDKNINFEFIDLDKNHPIQVHNCFYFPGYPVMLNSVNLIIEECKKYFSENTPFRKVYLSRKKVIKKDENYLFFNQDKSEFSSTDGERVDDETVLEEYFKSLGFEIAYPEDFGSMEEQIKFYSEIKTLASVSGSGLINFIFMKDGQKVLELNATNTVEGLEYVNSVFYPISFAKQHIYMLVSSMKNSKEYIDIIESNPNLKALVAE